MKVTVYWVTKNPETKERIRIKFNLPRYTTINGETEGVVNDDDLPLLQECEKRGFIQIRKKYGNN